MPEATKPPVTEPAATEPATPDQLRTVAILADDLIWSTRLADAVRAAGAVPRPVRRLEDLERLVEGAEDRERVADVIIDLTARAYDGLTAIRTASGTGARVVAVGQHDDAALRRAATDAGAMRVYTYRALFEDGPQTLARWLAG